MGEPEIDVKLTVPQAKTLRACVDFVASHADLGKWAHWREAAQADTRLFEAIEALLPTTGEGE